GLTGACMGCFQRKQAALRKVSIGPTLMIHTPATALAPLTLPQNATQTHADPAIQGSKGGVVAVLKVHKPALHGTVDVRDDQLQAPSLRALRLGANRVPKLLQALRSWPFQATLEVIPQ